MPTANTMPTIEAGTPENAVRSSYYYVQHFFRVILYYIEHWIQNKSMANNYQKEKLLKVALTPSHQAKLEDVSPYVGVEDLDQGNVHVDGF